MENNENCSVLYCVRQLRTVIRIHMWTVLKFACWFMFRFRLCVCWGLAFLGRLWQNRPNKAGFICPSLRAYVHTYVHPLVHKKFLWFQWNLAWHVRRGQWVMHDGMQYDLIQGQGHKPYKFGNSAVFKSYLHHLQREVATDHGFLN